MSKTMVFAWGAFICFVSTILWCGNNIPENYGEDDSVTKQYKITVNDSSIINAVDETKKQDEQDMHVIEKVKDEVANENVESSDQNTNSVKKVEQ